MKKNSLTSKGLSLSQAQSISNLCNQRAIEIDAKLNGINNFNKYIDITDKHNNTKRLATVVGKKIPSNVVDLLLEKASLHACQAFLMENIKAKDALLKAAKVMSVDTSVLVIPENKQLVRPVQLPEVGENFGWEMLSVDEICEFQKAEAFASHIGQFIHQGRTLDNLRKELPTISPIEWMVIKDGEKTPVIVETHHTSEELLTIHEKLAELHRSYEQRVNYFKSKVKNLTTIENARIARVNADAQHDAEKVNNQNQLDYQSAYKSYSEQIRTLQNDFEMQRQESIKNIAALKIDVNQRFQDTVDMFLNKLDAE